MHAITPATPLVHPNLICQLRKQAGKQTDDAEPRRRKGKGKRKPVLDRSTFVDAHHAMERQIEYYLQIGRRNGQTLTRDQQEELDRRSVKYLYANNYEARILYAERLHREMTMLIGQLARDCPISFVTLTPGGVRPPGARRGVGRRPRASAVDQAAISQSQSPRDGRSCPLHQRRSWASEGRGGASPGMSTSCFGACLIPRSRLSRTGSTPNTSLTCPDDLPPTSMPSAPAMPLTESGT